MVDDGIATGFTMMAAVESARGRGAEKVVVAVPVAPPGIADKFRGLANEVIVAETPPELYAVGAHYADFRQVTDDEVRQLLNEAGNVGA